MRVRKAFHFKPLTFNYLGFSLLEMLVVLAIIALLTAMSAPAISGYLKGARLKGAAQQVASSLRQARALAITKRTERAVVLYYTADANSVYENDQAVSKSLPETIVLANGSGTKTGIADEWVTFTARGSVKGLGTTIRVYDPYDNYREITVLNATGRVKVSDVQ